MKGEKVRRKSFIPTLFLQRAILYVKGIYLEKDIFIKYNNISKLIHFDLTSQLF